MGDKRNTMALLWSSTVDWEMVSVTLQQLSPAYIFKWREEDTNCMGIRQSTRTGQFLPPREQFTSEKWVLAAEMGLNRFHS